MFEIKQATEFFLFRTRDKEILETCDIVVDVGGVFDPEKHRYDHHQRSFSESMSSLKPGKKWTTKLSSAGLVYAYFGQKIIAQLIGVCMPILVLRESQERQIDSLNFIDWIGVFL